MTDKRRREISKIADYKTNTFGEKMKDYIDTQINTIKNDLEFLHTELRQLKNQEQCNHEDFVFSEYYDQNKVECIYKKKCIQCGYEVLFKDKYDYLTEQYNYLDFKKQKVVDEIKLIN